MSSITEKTELYLSAGRYELAEKILKEALEKEDNAHLRNYLGWTYHKQSKFHLALKEFAQAWQIDPDHVESRLNYAITLCDHGRYEKAESIIKQAQKHVDPQNLHSPATLQKLSTRHETLGDHYQECSMLMHAHNEYQKAQQLHPQSSHISLKIAKILMEQGMHDRAEAELEKIVHEPELQEHTRSLLGLIAHKKGLYAQAAAHWFHENTPTPQTKLLKACREFALRVQIQKPSPSATAATAVPSWVAAKPAPSTFTKKSLPPLSP